MNVTQNYLAFNPKLKPDPLQDSVIVTLQNLANQLEIAACASSSIWSFKKRKLVNGIYLWGGVGIGKTYLMDCFYQSLSFQKKLRIHFFNFMQIIHEHLTAYQGRKNPLDLIAKKLARDYLVICLDEFIVTDIVDAMVLANLLKALFSEKVTLVMTSNTAPDDLYYRGLQREKFLPAISLLKNHTQVIHMPSTCDYRKLMQQYTHNNISHETMVHYFPQALKSKKENIGTIEIAERLIKVIAQSEDAVWFSFRTICSPPRSQQDYLMIAKKYATVIVSEIPFISAEEKNTIRLFIALVDVFYDAGIHFIFSTSVPIIDIYPSGDMQFAFERTKSRLIEIRNRYFKTLHD